MTIITVISAFGATELPIADLNSYERNALAQILGISTARGVAFETLREMKIFQKIKPVDVWNTCPKHKKFPTEFTMVMLNTTTQGKIMAYPFKRIIPTALVSVAQHTLSGYCRDCNEVHEVSRPAVMVSTFVHGLKFSNLYEIQEEN